MLLIDVLQKVISFFAGVILGVTNHLRHVGLFVRALGETIFHLDQKIRASRRFDG